MPRNIGKQSGESAESVAKRKEGYCGEDLQKSKVLGQVILQLFHQGSLGHTGGLQPYKCAENSFREYRKVCYL